jgi:hypothetical protein
MFLLVATSMTLATKRASGMHLGSVQELRLTHLIDERVTRSDDYRDIRGERLGLKSWC